MSPEVNLSGRLRKPGLRRASGDSGSRGFLMSPEANLSGRLRKPGLGRASGNSGSRGFSLSRKVPFLTDIKEMRLSFWNNRISFMHLFGTLSP